MAIEKFDPIKHGYFPPEWVENYQQALSKIPRWRRIGIPHRRYSENDWQHTQRMHHKAQAIERFFPKIHHLINWMAVNRMIYLHDAGEIGAGDVGTTEKRLKQRKPIQEQKQAAFMEEELLPGISHDHGQILAEMHYQRYEDNNEDDLEAQLVRYCDKSQGNTTATRHVYNYKKMALEFPPEQIRLHMENSLEKALKPLLNMYRCRRANQEHDPASLAIKEAVLVLVEHELRIFENAGYTLPHKFVVEFGDILGYKYSFESLSADTYQTEDVLPERAFA